MKIRFPDRLFRDMLIIAKEKNIGVKQLIREAVREKIERYYREHEIKH